MINKYMISCMSICLISTACLGIVATPEQAFAPEEADSMLIIDSTSGLLGPYVSASLAAVAEARAECGLPPISFMLPSGRPVRNPRIVRALFPTSTPTDEDNKLETCWIVAHLPHRRK